VAQALQNASWRCDGKKCNFFVDKILLGRIFTGASVKKTQGLAGAGL
jgi:hypothetical protein